MTLVELMITITIIAILAGMILGAASVAGETARKAHTRHVITRLHTLITQHLDTYKTRRVKLRETVGSNKGVEQLINERFPSNAPLGSAKRGQALAEARLFATRELVLMEIPDRWSDVLLASVGTDESTPLAPNLAAQPLYLNARTELSNVYLRRYAGLIGRTNTITGSPNTAKDIRENQGAECLYMVITIACGDGEARTLFHESNIADTDGDGAPEFIDGWGNPINFLRWAPGFYSDLQLSLGPAGRLEEIRKNEGTAAVANAIVADHEPIDAFRVDVDAFRLVPLIYSWSGDKGSGLHTEEDYVPWRNSTQPLTVDTKSPYLQPRLTPYVGAPSVFLGSVRTGDGELSVDNIHNHLLGLKN